MVVEVDMIVVEMEEVEQWRWRRWTHKNLGCVCVWNVCFSTRRQ